MRRFQWNKTRIAAAVLSAVFALVILMILILKTDPETSAATEGYLIILGKSLNANRFTPDAIHNWLWGFTVAGSLLLLAGIWIRKPLFDRILFGILLCITAGASFFAFYQYGLVRRVVFDAGDTYHYFLGPKYFSEMGYTDHYISTVIALEEMEMEIPPFIRDLRNNTFVRTSTLLNEESRRYVHGLFSPERWETFKSDIRIFRDWHNPEGWRRRITDHGYNGTPVWNFFASVIANAVPVSHLNMTLLSLINLLMIWVMALLVLKAFGWRMGLFFLLMFCINYPDRYLLGGAFLRYFWISSLVSGIALMKLNKYGAAGGLIGLAALLRIFPIFFLGGIALKYMLNLFRKQPVPPEVMIRYRRFLNSAAVSMLALVLLSLSVGQGLQNWSGFRDQMAVNSGRFATGRIGFVYNFLYPKEVAPDDPQLDYEPRVAHFQEHHFLFFSWENLYYLLIILAVVGLVRIAGRMDDIGYTLILGFALFFLLFSTVRYYYAGLAGLPLMWHFLENKKAGKGFLLFLFLIMAGAYALTNRTIYCFIYNSWLSGMFAVYLAAVIAFFLWKVPVNREPPAPSPPTIPPNNPSG